jgi:hypothetical protein
MLKIGFYGPSTVSWKNSENRVSFIDQIADHYGAQIVNVGVPQGSEERILFELKKTKHIDIAVIFHTLPRYIFLPGCERDVSLDCVKPRKAKLLWTEKSVKKIPSLEEFKHEFFRYGGISELFKTTEQFVDAMSTMREYFYHPDLQTNRYQAAMLAIDSYLEVLGIPVFHSIVEAYTPQWLIPKTGTVDRKLTTWNWTLATSQNPHNPNNLTAEQNAEIFRILKEWIDKQI